MITVAARIANVVVIRRLTNSPMMSRRRVKMINGTTANAELNAFFKTDLAKRTAS